MPSRSSRSYSKSATVGASKNKGPCRTTDCTLRTSLSTSHRAIAYLCMTSSNRWPPGLSALKRQLYPAGSSVAWNRDSVRPTTVLIRTTVGVPIAPSRMRSRALRNGG